MNHVKILLAIPAYNCEKQISRVLDELHEDALKDVSEVAVIDNGSTDATTAVALTYRSEARFKNKLHVYKNNANFNLGGTHKVAFLKAEREGFTHVLILHGDNQAKSSEAKLLIDFMKAHPEHQTVLGSRFNRYSKLIGYDKKRIMGNRVLNALYSVVSFKHLEDLGSGLNLFALSDLDKSTYLHFADKLTFNYELILDLTRRKIDFAFFPITWREEDQVTNARNFNIFNTALKNLASWRFKKTTRTDVDAFKYKCTEIKK